MHYEVSLESRIVIKRESKGIMGFEDNYSVIPQGKQCLIIPRGGKKIDHLNRVYIGIKSYNKIINNELKKGTSTKSLQVEITEYGVVVKLAGSKNACIMCESYSELKKFKTGYICKGCIAAVSDAKAESKQVQAEIKAVEVVENNRDVCILCGVKNNLARYRDGSICKQCIAFVREDG